MQGTEETWVQSLGQEDHIEEEMTTCSSSLAWRIPWTEDPGGLQPMGCQRVGHYRSDLAHTHEVLKESIHVHHSGNDHRKHFHFQTGEGWQLRPTAGELKRDAGLFVSLGSWEDVGPQGCPKEGEWTLHHGPCVSPTSLYHHAGPVVWSLLPHRHLPWKF